MSGDEVEQEAVRWLWYALEDLLLAGTIASQRLSGARHIGWLAQQAAEKALKAILVYEEIHFPRTHDLTRLKGLVPEGWTARNLTGSLGRLTMFAVEARYPGEWEEADLEDVTLGLDLARCIVLAVRSDLLLRGLAKVLELPGLPGDAP